MRFHFVRDLLRAKIDIQFVASEEQHAGIWTKSLAATLFKSHGRFLLNLPFEGKGCDHYSKSTMFESCEE